MTAPVAAEHELRLRATQLVLTGEPMPQAGGRDLWLIYDALDRYLNALRERVRRAHWYWSVMSLRTRPVPAIPSAQEVLLYEAPVADRDPRSYCLLVSQRAAESGQVVGWNSSEARTLCRTELDIGEGALRLYEEHEGPVAVLGLIERIETAAEALVFRLGPR